MDKKKLIIIAVALIALVIVLAGVAIAMLQGVDSYAARIEEGYRYLQEGDFNNAILQFRYAIEEDGSREDGYYGLYQAYLSAGDEEMAITVLRVGVSSTTSTHLRQLLDSRQPTEVVVIPEVTEPEEPEQEDKNIQPILNTDILTLFASASYGDYCMQYDDSKGNYSAGQYTKHLAAIGATLVYYDTSTERVLDSGRGVPYNQYLPNEIRLDNIMGLFGGVSRLTFNDLTKLSGVADAQLSGDTITFSYGGCEITIICKDEGIITGNCENYIVPTGTGAEGAKQYNLSASIVDATTGAPVLGAKVKLYAGYNTFGEVIEEVATDNYGKASIDLEESGTYTAQVSKDGYITEDFEVYIMSNLQQTQVTFNISPTISGGGIRFVLSWGGSPSDLDSYLVGTASDGSYVNVNYEHMTATNASGAKVAELDVDDTSAYGPETITVYDVSGSYEFYVDDFTNSGMISSSGATVKIYIGSSLYTTVTIPAGIRDQWHVCTVNNGEVTVTNRSR